MNIFYYLPDIFSRNALVFTAGSLKTADPATIISAPSFTMPSTLSINTPVDLYIATERPFIYKLS